MIVHTRNTRTIIAALLVIFSFSSLNAQGDPKMDKFKEEKIKFFNEKLQLTEAEATVFWPAYEDLHNRRMKLYDEEKSLITYYSSNGENMSAKEVDETIENYFSLQKKQQDLNIQFHEKFVAAIGKAKTMKMYTLEREFRLHVLKQFQGGHGNPEGPGKHPNRGGAQ